jgi:hypothetical protein
MNLFPLIAAAALAQAPSAQSPGLVLPGGRPPANAYDSTVRALAVVGQRVAEVKSALGQFRRAAFNGQDAQVVQWGDTLAQRCRQLNEQAAGAQRTLCRGCLNARRQASVEEYRAVLPRVGLMARGCDTTLRQLRRDSAAATARNYRREVRNIGNRIVLALRPYEERLARVRDAFGWSDRTSPAPRPQRRS